MDGLVAQAGQDVQKAVNLRMLPVDYTDSVSVLIINHRSGAVLKTCLDALLAADQYIREIIIVDNPASNAAGHVPPAKYPKLKIIATPRRLGFGSAANFGAERASGSYLLILNPDIEIQANTVPGLLLAITRDADETVGLAVPRLTDVDGNFQSSCRSFPDITNLLYSRQSLWTRFFSGESHQYTLPDFENDTIVESAAAACLMIRSDLFHRLGGFDTRFFMYVEDTDLCLRANQHGYKLMYVPSAAVTHIGGYSTGRYPLRRIIWHHVSLWKFLLKHRSTIGTICIATPVLIVNCILSLVIKSFTLGK